MPREVVALVSADDLVAAVRVYADRVHDLLRRSGCGPEESVEVCESYAFGLVDAVVNAPETVGDLAGWWFARALELGGRLGGTAAETADAPTVSVLSGTSGEAQVRAALASLPERQRTAVLLRDGYDLPIEAVAVALRTDVDGAAAVVGAGRLALVSAYDDGPVPDVAVHGGRLPVDVATLARLADGSLPPPRTAPLRRHVASCRACEDVVDGLAKGRRLAAGLPVVAMPDEAREALLDRVSARAQAVLPSVDEVLLAVDEEHDARPAVSPAVAVLAIVLALVLGVAVAAITTGGGGGSKSLLPLTPTMPAESPSFSVSAAPSFSESASPTPSRTRSLSPTATASGTADASATATATVPAAVPARIRLSPTEGPRGTDITVTGRGWEPGAAVTVQYSATLGSRTTTAADARGRFTATVTANGALPGSYRVTASGGGETAEATFQQT